MTKGTVMVAPVQVSNAAGGANTDKITIVGVVQKVLSFMIKMVYVSKLNFCRLNFM